MTRVLILACSVLAAALLAACAEASLPPSASPTPAPTASSTPAPIFTRVPTPTVVPLFTRATEIKDALFEPEFVVAVGTEVTWTNRDTVLHTVTAKNGSSDSNAFGRGERYAKLFSEPGRWEFFCVLHRTMIGAVVVE